MSARVLVVDDAAFMRMMIKEILTKNGYTVVGEASDGHQAVALYKELQPDVVTMDITMPEMDGIAALKEIKKIDPNAKVIMCSAMGQQAMVIDAIQRGPRTSWSSRFRRTACWKRCEKCWGRGGGMNASRKAFVACALLLLLGGFSPSACPAASPGPNASARFTKRIRRRPPRRRNPLRRTGRVVVSRLPPHLRRTIAAG